MKKKTLLVSSLILILMVSVFALPTPVSATPGAEIAKITGVVKVQKKGTPEWVEVKKVPYTLEEGDKIKTDANSEAEITAGGAKLKMGENSEGELVKDPETGRWGLKVAGGIFAFLCIFCLFKLPGWLKALVIVCALGGLVVWIVDTLTAAVFRESATVQTYDEYGSLIAQTNITGSLGLYPNGIAWANGQQVSISDDGTISEPIEVSLSPSEAMELYKFVYGEGGVGGIVISVDKFGLLAPYIGLASTILAATIVTTICIKRVKHRKEKKK